MGRRLTPSERIDAATPEQAVLEAVMEAARFGGWLACHHPDSRRMAGDPGLPDVVLAHPRRGVLFVECKARSGRLRAGQARWRTVLEAAGAAVVAVRPGEQLRLLAGWLAAGDGPAAEAPAVLGAQTTRRRDV